MVLGSFVPPRAIRELRDVTRRRTEVIADRGREIQRLEKELEDTGMKLTSVLSDVSGVGSRRILHALIEGERDPRTLADLTVGTARRKIGALVTALDGTFTAHHAFMCRHYLDQIDHLGELVAVLGARIAAIIAELARDDDIANLGAIPGVARTSAEIIIAETGGDMSHFATAAMAAIKQKDSYYGVYYRRLAARRGAQRALVAVMHKLTIAIWHVLHDYVTYRDPQRAIRRMTKEANALGLTIRFDPIGG